MNDSAPPSPPTTAGQRRPADPLGLEQRRELQRRWEQARELMRQRPCDHDRVHALLVDCVVQDPASPLYVDALLQNLSGKSQSKRRRPWLRGWRRRRALRDAWRAAKWDEVLRTGPDLLGGNPWNSVVFLLPLIPQGVELCFKPQSLRLFLCGALVVALDSGLFFFSCQALDLALCCF